MQPFRVRMTKEISTRPPCRIILEGKQLDDTSEGLSSEGTWRPDDEGIHFWICVILLLIKVVHLWGDEDLFHERSTVESNQENEIS